MIHYPYECPKCKHFVLEPASWFAEHENCPECDTTIKKAIGVVRERGLDPVFGTPIKMFSIAPETPDELKSMRKKFPDMKLTDQGVPLAHTRAEKLAYLEHAGFEEHS